MEDRMTSNKTSVKVINQHGPMGFVLFLGWIGAAVYFVHHSHGFWGFILALLKACVWPAYVVYHALMLMRG
jgi:hypothetical protein